MKEEFNINDPEAAFKILEDLNANKKEIDRIVRDAHETTRDPSGKEVKFKEARYKNVESEESYVKKNEHNKKTTKAKHKGKFKLFRKNSYNKQSIATKFLKSKFGRVIIIPIGTLTIMGSILLPRYKTEQEINNTSASTIVKINSGSVFDNLVDGNLEQEIDTIENSIKYSDEISNLKLSKYDFEISKETSEIKINAKNLEMIKTEIEEFNVIIEQLKSHEKNLNIPDEDSDKFYECASKIAGYQVALDEYINANVDTVMKYLELVTISQFLEMCGKDASYAPNVELKGAALYYNGYNGERYEYIIISSNPVKEYCNLLIKKYNDNNNEINKELQDAINAAKSSQFTDMHALGSSLLVVDFPNYDNYKEQVGGYKKELKK